jgi:acyl dehydratase
VTDQYCETLYWEDVAVGEKGPELVVENIERKDFVRFAGATGDFNPMHYDDPAAKAAGHPSAFGPGMLTGGFGAHMLCGWFGIENVRSFSVRFTDRVWPGDTVTVTGEVTEKDDDDGVVEAEFEVSNQDGKTVVTGTATAALPSRDTG